MAEAKPPACPVCGEPRAEQFRPFCSRACADRDLLAWLREDYAAPGEPLGRESGDGDRAPDDDRR